MILKGTLNFDSEISGIIKKYKKGISISEYSGKIVYFEKSINSILDFIPLVKGIVIKEGGVLSHVAIVCREFMVPSILGLDLDPYFDNEAMCKISGANFEFEQMNYLIPTSSFVGLFRKYNDYYLLYNDSLKITLNEKTFNLISLLSCKKISEVVVLFGEESLQIVENLIEDHIFCFSNCSKDFYKFSSDLSSPDILDLQITDVCNMNCKYCYSNIQNKGQTIPFDKLKKILSDAKEIGVSFVSITGGEPTLYPEFNQLVNYLKSNNFIIHCNINGSNLSPDIIDSLKQINDLGVSLDSLSKKYALLRGKNLMTTVYKNIKELIKSKIKFKVVVVVSKVNINELDSLIKELFELGVRDIKLNYCLPIGRGKTNKLDVYVPYSKYIEKYLFLKDKYSSINILNDTNMFYFRYDETKKIFMQDISCSAYVKRISLRSDGKIVGCLFLDDSFVVGDVFKDSFKDIVAHIPQNFKIKSKLNYKNSYCNDCEYFDQCGMGCLTFIKDNGIFDPRCPKVELYDSKKKI